MLSCVQIRRGVLGENVGDPLPDVRRPAAIRTRRRSFVRLSDPGARPLLADGDKVNVSSSGR